MRPKQLMIVGTGILILCASLLIRQAAKSSDNAEINKRPMVTTLAKSQPVAQLLGRSPRVAETTANPSLQTIPGGTIDTPRKRPSSNTVSVPSSNNLADHTPTHEMVEGSMDPVRDNFAQLPEVPPIPNSLPMGIQLGADVKLPAVILAISAAERDPQVKIPAPVAAAMHGIVDTFYRDLADSAGKADAVAVPDPHGAETGAGEEDALVIHPGPAVEQARENANETYRALFGDTAYDQMTMRALMESHLPASPVTAEN